MDPGLALHRAAEATLVRGYEPAFPLLDLGCHDGGFAALALTPVGRTRLLLGGDRDVAALAHCRRRRVHRAVCALAAEQLPFRSGVWSSVLCNSLLTHVEDLPRVLREIARVLAPGGALLASVPTPAFYEFFGPARALKAVGLSALSRRVAGSYGRLWQQRHVLPRHRWQAVLGEAGLRLESWTEYLDARASLLWSGLFAVTRMGKGRVTLGALLRRLFPPGGVVTGRVESRLASWLAPSVGAVSRGGSTFFVARKLSSTMDDRENSVDHDARPRPGSEPAHPPRAASHG
jgi:SAM-dependent methyltransferase